MSTNAGITLFTTIGSVRGASGRFFATREGAEADCERDHREVKAGHGSNSYSDRRVVEVPFGEALSVDRIPWAVLKEAGVDLEAVRDEAATHGDPELARKAAAAIRRTR